MVKFGWWHYVDFQSLDVFLEKDDEVKNNAFTRCPNYLSLKFSPFDKWADNFSCYCGLFGIFI